MVAQYKHPIPRSEKSADLVIQKGAQVSLVRWAFGRDGWAPETVEGRYLGRGAEHIILDVEGERSVFDRETWSVCVE